MSVGAKHDTTWESDALHLYSEIPNSDLKKEIYIVEAQKQYEVSEKEAEQWYDFAWQNHENRIVDYYDPKGDLQNPVSLALTLTNSMQKSTAVVLSKQTLVDKNMTIDDRVILVNSLSELKEYLKNLKKIIRTLFDFDKETFCTQDEQSYSEMTPAKTLKQAQKVLSTFQKYSDDIYKNIVDLNMPEDDYDKDVENVYNLYATVGEYKCAVKHAKKLVQSVFSL